MRGNFVIKEETGSSEEFIIFTEEDFISTVDSSPLFHEYCMNLKSWEFATLTFDLDPIMQRYHLLSDMHKKGYDIPQFILDIVKAIQEEQEKRQAFLISLKGEKSIIEKYHQYRLWLQEHLPNRSPLNRRRFHSKLKSL